VPTATFVSVIPPMSASVLVGVGQQDIGGLDVAVQ
jgi:hypothetical protein